MTTTDDARAKALAGLQTLVMSAYGIYIRDGDEIERCAANIKAALQPRPSASTPIEEGFSYASSADLFKELGTPPDIAERQERELNAIIRRKQIKVMKDDSLATPDVVEVPELEARIEAAKLQLRDAKAIHSRWSLMPGYEAEKYAQNNMATIEQIIYSAICYLEGMDGPNRKALQPYVEEE